MCLIYIYIYSRFGNSHISVCGFRQSVRMEFDSGRLGHADSGRSRGEEVRDLALRGTGAIDTKTAEQLQKL